MRTLLGKIHARAALPVAFALAGCSSSDDAGDLSGAGGSVASAGSGGLGASGGATAGAGALGGSAAGTGGNGVGAAAGAGATGSGGMGLAGAGAAGAGTAGGGAAGGGTGGGGSGGKGGAQTGGAGAGSTGMAGSGGSLDPSDHSPEGTCARWNADRADMSEGTWSGELASCEPGEISANGHENALRLVNLYRWLADLPAVTTEPAQDLTAQACALLMDANGMLSHDPPMDWDCWSQDAYDGASSSNISSGPGVGSVDGYMIDGGNEDTLGHRRWILSNTLGPIGLGSTGAMGASCMQTLSGKGKAGKTWLAWPPPGPFPAEAIKPGRFGGSLGTVGYSIQSDSIDLAAGTLTITSGGEELPVMVMELPGGYGSRYALNIQPDGWEMEAGNTYTVTLSGASMPITYDIAVVDCAQ